MNGWDRDFIPRAWLLAVDQEVVMLEILLDDGFEFENNFQNTDPTTN